MLNKIEVSNVRSKGFSRKSLEWMKSYIGFLFIILLTIFPGVSSAASANILINPGFELGTAPWFFYTNGAGTFLNNAPGIGSSYAGHITITSPGTNVQLYQAGLVLDPNTRYNLSFKAYSNTGHDLSISMQKHGSPYTNYGLSNNAVNLGTSWSDYSVQFTTSGFSTTVSDGRFMFWLAPYDAASDQYFFEDVVLTKVTQDTQVPPIITTQPASKTITAGQTAIFSVVASGTAPLMYQWQKNGTNITGATSAMYTKPSATLLDNGAYRVIVTNAYGSVTSNEVTLSVIVVSTGTIVSDDFNDLTLDSSIWTPINPRGDATITVIGTGTSDALLSIAVPPGQDHDAWTTNNAPRVMQSIDNKNFEVELKFQSRTTLPYQIQGLIIQQDSSNYLRFDFYSNSATSATTNIFATSFASGIPLVRNNFVIPQSNPMFMRINRTGDLWKQFYSNDGNTWILSANFNYPMIVSSIGPFAGNAVGSTSPAFTSLVDYFFETSSPIVPEDTPLPPSITVQPVNTTAFIGSSATFSVVASGSPGYQWKKNGVNITSATGASYTTPTLTLTDNGSKFSVVVSNAYGSVTSNVVTLSVIGVSTRNIVSDDFNALILDTSIWTPINPRGDATITVIGTGTSDALLSIAVPPGQDHDAWTTNNAPRVMQSIDNKNFEIELKFQSLTAIPYQEQGLIIQQDSSNYIRFDFYSNSATSATTNIFATSFAAGSPSVRYNLGIPQSNPMWMRINRTGDSWKQFYSNDGNTWILAANFNYPMIVSSIGPYAGNAVGSSSPAFTSLVDYFFDTSSPIIPEDTPLPPSITVQPVNRTAFNGSSATFSVVAGGTPPLSYQWKKNGVNIVSATGPSYTTPILKLLDNGTKFSVVVSNAYGSLTSNEVKLSVIEFSSNVQWWDTQRKFRIPVTVNAAQYERNEKPVETAVNFTRMLNILGQAGTLDENSLRIVETDSIGTVLSSTVPFQFDKDTGFNAATKASGTIVFMMSGKTPANTARYYQVYFGLTGGSYSPLTVSPRVTLTDNVPDEGQLSYQIGAAGSTYYLQKQAGGLSSLVDASGNDWINFHSIPSNSAGGEYRGIPNIYAGGVFHPGWITGSSSIVSQGPLKIRVRSVTNDGLWESNWDFYPGYATNTIVRANVNYWWLYEGTPGGSLDQNTDFMIRSDGQKTLLSVSVNSDIPTNEWAYFSDPNVNRSLFLSHHEDDSLIDEYHPMTDAGGSMVVFGFGRTYPMTATISPLSGPQHFTMGLMDGTEFTPGSKTVYSAYKNLSIATGMVEQLDSVSAPIIVTQPAASSVTSGNTATFSVGAIGQLPLSYQWQKNNVNIPGATNASYTTPPTTLSDNGANYRVVVTNAKGSVTSNQAILTISAASNPNQLIIMDENYIHNNNTMAFTFFGLGNIPANLVSPINYAGGTLYERLQVITKPSMKTVNYQLCLFQDQIVESKHACADYIRFTGTGTYYASQPMTSLYQYYNITWSRSLLDRMLVVKDIYGMPVDTRWRPPNGTFGPFDGEDLGLYYPMQVRYTAIIVAPNGGQPTWP